MYGPEPPPLPPPDEKNTDENENGYVKATTTKGMKTVGGPGWGTKEWKKENEFHGFDQLYCNHCDVY